MAYDEITARDAWRYAREQAALLLDTDLTHEELTEAAMNLASAFRDLDTGTVTGRRNGLYVLYYSHEYGSDITVYSTEEAADAAAAGIAREYWDDVVSKRQAVRDAYGNAVTWDDELPESHEGLSDEEVTERYFDAVSASEHYEIQAATIR